MREWLAQGLCVGNAQLRNLGCAECCAAQVVSAYAVRQKVARLAEQKRMCEVALRGAARE
jgi:hypothetical protein